MTETSTVPRSGLKREHPWWHRYGSAVVAVGVAALLKSALRPWVDQESPYLFFFAAVMASAWRGGAGPGLLATLLAAAASDFLFRSPFYTFGDVDRKQALRLAQFLSEGAVISLLGGALHRARRRAQALAAGEQAARHEAEDARREAEAAQADLARAFEREKRIAETLQRSLLLKIPPGRFDPLDVAPFYEPALDEAEIGGDFYDAFLLPGGQVALAVGDVSGKGLGAAALTAEAKFALRALLYEDAAPERALGRLNRFLCLQQADRRRAGDGEGAGNRFLALSLAVVDPASGRARLAAAGSEPPLLLRAGGGGAAAAEEIKGAGGLVLGVSEEQDEAAYTAVDLVLGAGDTLLLLTDGITEARAPGRGGALLEYEGVAALVGECCRGGESVAALGQRVLDGAKRFAGGALRDDACLLLARRVQGGGISAGG